MDNYGIEQVKLGILIDIAKRAVFNEGNKLKGTFNNAHKPKGTLYERIYGYKQQGEGVQPRKCPRGS